jgi:hypothetical protein
MHTYLFLNGAESVYMEAAGYFLTIGLVLCQVRFGIYGLLAEHAVEHHRLENEKPTLFDQNQEELEQERIENADEGCCEYKCKR